MHLLYNSLWPSITFTVELEDINRTITFLELKIKINEHGALEYQHQVKATSSGRYVNFQSHCPMSMKSNIVKMEASRVINNCSNIEDIYPHLNNLGDNFIMSGYPITFINNIFIPLIQNIGNWVKTYLKILLNLHTLMMIRNLYCVCHILMRPLVELLKRK